jgi:N utilization substance protein B
MPRRSRAREVALQLLYEVDRNEAVPQDRDRQFVESRLRGPALRQFALDLVAGVLTKQAELDRLITQAAHHWSLDRMTPVDRSILRLATFEYFFHVDTPHRVAIDEAIELAKRFGTADSPRFVNGILDRIVTTHPRGERADDAPGQDPAPSESAAES